MWSGLTVNGENLREYPEDEECKNEEYDIPETQPFL
jgi:hypothetical protein